MIKEVRYNGYAANPSEYQSADGDLGVAMNLVPEDGGLKLMEGGKEGFDVPPEFQIFIHSTGRYTHYIAYKERPIEVLWYSNDFSEVSFESINIIGEQISGEIKDITAIGNVIIVSTTESLHYIRYSETEERYIYLGTHIPEVDIDFNLALHMQSKEVWDTELKFEEVESSGSGDTGKDDWTLITVKSFDIDVIPAGGARIDLDQSVVCKAGVEYRFSWEWAVVHTSLRVMGVIDGKEEVLWHITANITSKRVLRSDAFVWDKDVTGLYLIFVNDSFGATYGSFWLHKGIERDDVGTSITHRITYNEESYNRLLGAINSFVNDDFTKKNRFVFPFFVRYAVKLFDGSYSQVSPPMLMIPNSDYSPKIGYFRSSAGAIDEALMLSAFGGELQYRVLDATMAKSNWGELIRGIDIFVSQPIYPYDQGENYDGSKQLFTYTGNITDSLGVGVPYYDGEILDGNAYPRKVYMESLVERFFGIPPIGYIKVSERNNSDIMESLKTINNYYKIASLDLVDLEDAISFKNVEMEEETLVALPARERLSEDGIPYPGYKSAQMISYNSRLHLFQSEYLLPDAVHPGRCRGYEFEEISGYHIVVYVQLKTDSGDRLVKDRYNSSMNCPFSVLGWYYYPDSRATKAIVMYYNEANQVQFKFEMQLRAHDFLNGAYWVGETLLSETFDYIEKTSTDEYADLPILNSIPAPSTIYISQPYNPFVFMWSDVVSIGVKKIIGLASAARALSEGQFGQFPLYAFTTEGVWALSVNDTGTFNPAQPISRDVCVDADSITQIDQSVLFATNRGVMMIAGSETICMTDGIDTDSPMLLSMMPGGLQLMSKAEIGSRAFDMVAFKDYLQGARMVYDYTHQRIVLYQPRCDYAYVYSLKSKQWGMMESEIQYGVNSYPEALVVMSDNKLVDLSSAEGKLMRKGLMVTRALKLDGGDILKTIDTIIQRGDFDRDDVSTVLWGSRDLKNWHLIWTSKDHYLRGFRGSPYKYYRIGAITEIGREESLIGASISYQLKQTNKLR